MNIKTDVTNLAEISELLFSEGTQYSSDIEFVMKLEENVNDLATVKAFLGQKNTPPILSRTNVISNEEIVKIIYDCLTRWDYESESFLLLTAKKDAWATPVERPVVDVGLIESEFKSSIARNHDNYIATVHIGNDQDEKNHISPYVTMLCWEDDDTELYYHNLESDDKFLIDDLICSVRTVESLKVPLLAALFTLLRITDAEFDDDKCLGGLNKKPVHQDELIRFCIMSQTNTKDLTFGKGRGHRILRHAIRKEKDRVERDVKFSIPAIGHEDILHYWAEYWRTHNIPHALPLIRTGK